MTSERIEWVEIIEPRTKEHMYANLTTGECVWDPPEGVPIRRTDASQWWELFDTNTQRFYYYNAASQATVWHKPSNCDIIPLAKLQKLKQNSDSGNRKEIATQTSHARVRSHKSKNDSATGGNNFSQQSSSSDPNRALLASTSDNKGSSELPSSPHGRYCHRLPSSDNSITGGGGKTDSYKYCRHSQSSAVSHGGRKHKESGKSSDSSISSTHGYRRLHESGSLKISGSQHKNKHISDNSCHVLQESSSSHNIPHVPFSIPPDKHQQHYHHSKLSCSISNSSDLSGLSPTHSINTPIMKKKSSESNVHINKHDGISNATKHQSFDYPSGSGGGGGNSSAISLTRSGSFMSSPASSHQYSHRQTYRKSSIDGNGGNGGGASDDSMHEKYFKSVENTPITGRRQTSSGKCSNKKHSSDSSPQSPISPQNYNNKSAEASILHSLSVLEAPSVRYSVKSSSHKNDSNILNLDLTGNPEKYMEKMKINKRSPNSCENQFANAQAMGTLPRKYDNHKVNSNILKISPSSGGGRNMMPTSSSQHGNCSSLRSTSKKDHYLDKPITERYNKDVKNTEKSQSRSKHRKYYAPSSDVEYDNGNISPLYSNWDQEHLLPLQHYIIEQAKLSGCYGFGDPLDSDSFHSDSQSEHSFSGHEPDNEDSDHSDGRGDYLSHNYGLMEDYTPNMDGVSYYNYLGFNKEDREEISDSVEAVLESERDNTQIYSPVRSHPFRLAAPSSPKLNIQQQQKKTASQQISVQELKEEMNKHRPPPPIKPHRQQSMDDNLSTQNQKRNFQPPSSTVGNGGINSGASQLAIMKECDIEKFAQDNLNLHSKGIFRKKSSIRDMLSWTANAITRPMLALSRDKAGKKLATELFKLVQIYMGDRKARAGMSLNSVAIDIIMTALSQPQLRDELYVQLCRQTTENPKRESLIRGWELMAICLSFVPPSPTFQPALLNYMNRHRDPSFATSFPEVGKWPIHVQISHYATVCCRRLDRIGNSARKKTRKPNDDEIEQARAQILRDSMFGNTLLEVMELQKDRYPERKLPWIQVTLSEQVLLLSGKQTEGIFRVSADVDEVNCLKNKLDRWEVPEHKNTMDAHAPASLLKLWYRELYDPLIPDELYNECVQTEDPVEADRIINKLPDLNKLVLTYLINFLQQFILPDVVSCTKMDSSNLAMVFAPNCLRCTSDDPKVILENARKEMAFMRTLIQHMDTSSVINLI